MVHNVFKLHDIAAGPDVKFPFTVPDYQSYIFGDGRLAHRFGTQLAKAFIAHATQSLIEGVAVAVISGDVPTASQNLRNHFVACLNRHLIANNAHPVRKIELYAGSCVASARDGPQTSKTAACHIDHARLGNRTLVVLGDLRMNQTQEDAMLYSLRQLNINNPIIFVYLAAFENQTCTDALSTTLSSVVSPTLKDIDRLAQSPSFVMNDVFVRFVLGRHPTDFCRFIRGQDDSFARLLLDYAISGGYYQDGMYEQNFKFLLWELGTRESM
ncbi:PRTase ComF-like protein [Paraphoma chrysanthemicola]|nr:PRTase ComF-like protein [Paraphoma chrysanthemicola]